MTVAQRSIQDLEVGQSIGTIQIPITLQRLVMEAGANRDLSLIHHDGNVARTTGASDAYANTFFLMGMFERLCRDWMGPGGRIANLGPMKMLAFNVVGDTVTFSGEVAKVDPAAGRVTLSLAAGNEQGRTAICGAVLEWR